MLNLTNKLGGSGLVDDWDPQNYSDDEEEDTIAPGMHFLDEDDETDELDPDLDEELPLEDEIAEEEEEEEEEVTLESELDNLDLDPLTELDILGEEILKKEKDSLRLTDYSDEEL